MNKPDYFQWKLPADYLFRIIPALIFQLKRNFREDSIRVLKASQINIESSGVNRLPTKGPVLYLVNHFSAPGFSALWLAMSMAATVPADITWTMTDAWTFPKRRFRKLARNISRIILTRIAKTYGFITFQPISEDPTVVIEQALAIRRIIHFAKDHPQSVLSIAPEGRDTNDGTLGNPPPNAGLLINAIAKLNYKLIPVGFYASEDTCHLNFGKPISLKSYNGRNKDEIDRKVSQKVMQSIRDLLPMNTGNKKSKEQS